MKPHFKPIKKSVSAIKYDFKDVLIAPQRPSNIVSQKRVCERSNHVFSGNRTWWGPPIFTSPMDTVGNLYVYNKLHNRGIVTTFNHKMNNDLLLNDYDLDERRYSLSTGIKKDDIDTVKEVIEKYKPKFLCIDRVNGYSTEFIDTVSQFRVAYPNLIIIAGNVFIPEMIPLLTDAGADIIKIGSSSESLRAGVGYPQISAILDCWETAQEQDVKIMSDGGINTAGDICKALAAGADFVMLGGQRDVYDENDCITAEKSITRGVDDIFDSLRSCCVYLGANSPAQIYNNSKLIRIQ